MQLRSRVCVWLCALIGLGSPAAAQQGPVVVELFTSQGCVACPPADKLMDRLADRDDVIALALHVDYWDYIGWVDSFGKAAFSERQKSYARNNGRASVYTPQIIVGGLDEVRGSSAAQVMGAIATHLGANSGGNGIRLSLTQENGQTLVIEAAAENGLAHSADIQIVRYIDAETVDIEAGENAGRQVTYRNIVTTWDRLADWDGAGPFRQSVTVEGDDGVVVIIQEKDQGAVLAAARHRR